MFPDAGSIGFGLGALLGGYQNGAANAMNNAYALQHRTFMDLLSAQRDAMVPKAGIRPSFRGSRYYDGRPEGRRFGRDVG